MPHIEIKCFPRDLSDEQKAALSAEITDVIIRHLDSKESAISISLQPVAPEAWKNQVWDTDISPHMAQLIKKPGYTL